jgi:hypothetical protein
MGSSSAVTPEALNRLRGQAAGQLEANSTQLALTPYEYGAQPIMPQSQRNPTAQDMHPSAQRMASGQWGGKTSQLNRAQAAQDQADIWVTVPVDKVMTRGQVSTANPVYAAPKGYVPRPGDSSGSIPPTIPTTRPY